jgi:spectinomycin phosphotransferase
VYPFVDGHNGYEAGLTDRQWVEFGSALKWIHTVEVPSALTSRIRRERYSPRGRDTVKQFLSRVEHDTFDDPVAAKLAAFMRDKHDEIAGLVTRAERLAQMLQARPRQDVVCHSDIHAGNILLGSDDAFYIVDWDEPILAPKERDLMYAGGGLMGGWRAPQEEERLFYQGYGQVQIDHVALAYYRYERIVQDIYEYCQQLFLTDEGGQDREQSLQYLASNFQPNSTIEIAYQSDKVLG